jgi:hypothetical protein
MLAGGCCRFVLSKKKKVLLLDWLLVTDLSWEICIAGGADKVDERSDSRKS